jgi:MoaA/NifB/PqqE/SkfB family radical SAM enzyme
VSGYGERMARFWDDNRLFTVLLELTYRCNLDCVFCYNDLALAGKPLSLADYRTLIDDLATMGVLHLSLSGGEPLAHPDFFAIGAHARQRGFAVRVKSNGHALRGALARRLREEVDPYLIEVSLHGASAATHDRQTRVAGSFERLLANLAGLRELGLRVQLNSTLTAWNEAELAATFELADRLGLPLQVDPEVTPRDDGDRSPLDLAPSRAGVRRLFEIQAERLERAGAAPVRVARHGDEPGAQAASGKHCGAGSSHLTIDPFGNVYPCVQWRRPVGNLHETAIAGIWSGSAGLAEVRRIETEIPAALATFGGDAREMGFCPGLAEQTQGAATAVYGAAVERLTLRREVVAQRPGHARLPVVG